MRFVSPWLLLLPLGGAAVGCGPYMRTETLAVRAYDVPERCGQGPYEITVMARGARWGEHVALQAYSPRPLEGCFEVTAGDVIVGSGSFGSFEEARPSTQTTGDFVVATSDAPFDNSACMIQSGPDAPMGSGGEVFVPVPEPTVEVPVTAGGEEVTTASLVLTERPWARPYDLGPVEMYGQHLGRLRIGDHGWTNDDFEDSTPPIAEGTPIRIRFWSNTPNLLEGVTFVVTHVIRVPSVPEEEWIAHLRQRRLDEEREDRERAIENQRRAEQRHQHCAAHHEDTGCWGPGGYEGAVRRMEEAARRPRRPAPVQVAVAPPEPPRPRTPEGPPPPPQAERRPPQPSLHATWVTGYWRWHAERWVWVGGIWDVPEEDLIAEATVQAPEAPPPARVEVRAAAPAPDMVWVPGYWQWDGARFAWIDGRWDLPRREGTVWQAPTWRPRARGGVAFVPGGWVVTVRR